MAGTLFDEVPSQSVAYGPDVCLAEQSIIFFAEAIMLSARDNIDAGAIEAAMGCAFEAAHEKRLKQRKIIGHRLESNPGLH